MPSPDNRYLDLLGDAPDQAMTILVDDLAHTYSARNPAAMPPPHLRAAIAESLQARATTHPPRPIRARRLPGIGWPGRHPLVLAIMAAGLIAGAAYASIAPKDPTIQLTQRAYRWTPGLASLMQRYSHTLHLSNSACGYTVQLVRAFADANRIIVAYTLSGPPNRSFVPLESDWPQLTNTQGLRAQGVELGMSDTMFGTTGGYFAAFDAHTIAHGALQVNLRFSLPTFSMTERLTGNEPASAPCETYSNTGQTLADDSASSAILDRIHTAASHLLPGIFANSTSHRVRTVIVHRTITIPFSVPVDPARREIDPHQALTAGGTTLILDRVIATRSETRIYLRRATAGHILEAANLYLMVSGHQFGGLPLFGDWWTRVAPASRRYDFMFAGPSYSYRGVYTLLVQADPNLTQGQRLTGGPWTFHFRLP